MYLYNKKTNNTGGMLLCDDEHMMLMQSSLQIQKKKCKLDRAILINSVYFNLYLLKTIFKDFRIRILKIT